MTADCFSFEDGVATAVTTTQPPKEQLDSNHNSVKTSADKELIQNLAESELDSEEKSDSSSYEENPSPLSGLFLLLFIYQFGWVLWDAVDVLFSGVTAAVTCLSASVAGQLVGRASGHSVDSYRVDE